MKPLKLQLGKTYRNRKGEEVKIVKRNDKGRCPYQGNNEEWYTESGRWEDFVMEDPEDLIEEVTMSDGAQEHNKMEQIKLEVGNTYRSREGKEVRIITKAFSGRPSYQGDNGNWYTENGKWSYGSPKDSEDLIEKVVSDVIQTQDKMKQIKLEVGKTYRNRKGEVVKIIENEGIVEYSYEGSNGEWYTESGRWSYYSEEHPKDLIEEVTATRHAFDIPEGVKKVTVEQVGNCIVVEMVPEKEPKPGDVMVNEYDSVYIFKKAARSGYHIHYAWLGESGELSIGWICNSGRPATPEEAQPLWDALKKAGKRWNAETMQVEDVPERDRIREWMDMNIKCGGEVVDIAEVIERYLKHREDNK